jgi:FkbM family methyltransferase
MTVDSRQSAVGSQGSTVKNLELRSAPTWVHAVSGVIRRLPGGRYRAMNWIGAYRVDPFWARLPADLGALVFRCDLHDRLMREVCLTGRYEPQETALLQRILAPGMVFVDVGANWGYFTLAAAHLVGPEGKVVAVEADPRACQTLRENAVRNALDCVEVFEVAASDVAGTVRMQEYEASAGETGNFGLARTTTVVEHGRHFEVQARPLDDVLDDAGVERVDLLKMDIEGAEGPALAGLARSLRSRRVTRLLLEIHPQHLLDQGSSAERVIGDLRSFGYRPWKIDHSPAAYRRFASGNHDVVSALTPLEEGDVLGPWPHVLWT